MKELPIGVQTFEDIVSGNYYYVDKTGMVHQLANKLCVPQPSAPFRKVFVVIDFPFLFCRGEGTLRWIGGRQTGD